MKIEGMSEQYLSAGGKFFVQYDFDEKCKPLYRQIELYLPSAEGTYGEPIEVTMKKWLDQLEDGSRDWKWAIGSTGGQLTARYQVRESDGELVSLLALKGGMA